MVDCAILVLALIAVASCCTTWCFQGLLLYRLRQRPVSTGAFTPPISILKPLAGVEEGMLENLRSVAQQDYPCFEIIFGVRDADDPALRVAEQVMGEFPQVPMHMVVGHAAFGHNPKVNNLAAMARRARHEYWLISDANVRVAPNYLEAIAAECRDPGVGLVCNIVAGRGGRSLGAVCEDLHLNTFIAPSVAGAMMLGDHPCVVGKSMLMRRGDFEALGGFAAVRNVLAEDYILGQRFHLAGWRVAISSHIVEAVHERRPVRHFLARHVRWAQMRRRLVPGHYVGELLLNPSLWLAFVAWAAAARPETVLAVALAWAVKIAIDLHVMRRMGTRTAAWRLLMALAIKDWLVAGLWCVGAFRRAVAWRGHSMRIGRNSVLYYSHETEPTFVLQATAAATGG